MKILNKSVILVSCSCMLTACMPSTHKLSDDSKVGVPPEWRHHAYNEVTADISPQWWNAYGDPVLTSLVERALKSNVQVQQADVAVERARAQVMVAQSLLWPDINGTAAGSRSKEPGGSVPGLPQYTYKTTGSPGFQASYELDIWGKNRDRAAAAEYAVAASQASSEAARISVASTTAQTYITLRALDARLQLLRETLRTREENLSRIRKQFKYGYSPELELNQAQVQYATVLQQIPTVERTIASTENALSTLVGVPPQAIPRGKAFDDFVIPDTPKTLPSQLLISRPDIAGAEYMLAASNKSLSAARKDFLPTVSISSTVNWIFSSGTSADPFNVWSAGGSVLAPIFTGGRLTGQFELATADQKLAALDYKDAVLNAFNEVEDQLVAVEFLKQQADAQKQQLTASQKAYRHAMSRYREGYSPYLEVTDAEQGLLTIQSAVIQTRAQRLNASISLYKALGGGWHREVPGVTSATQPATQQQ